MKQPKWIVSVEAARVWQPGYWVERGWSKDGVIETMAAVDVVVRRGDVAEVGGIAFAGSRGVAKVEVRVAEGGEWREAEVRQPLSDLTWVVWRVELPVARSYVARAFQARSVVSSRA